jgi:signal transduction histidine kinase
MDQSTSQRWLAYELHDGLLQWIIGARLQLVAAKSRDDQSLENLQRAINRAITSLEMSLAEARELISYLEQQPNHDEMRLVVALNCFIERAQRDAQLQNQQIVTSINAEHLQQFDLSLGDTASWNLLRIAQQAIRNAISHAGPTTIHVQLRYLTDSRELELVVEDSGRGFDASRRERSSQHFGLSSMTHRAQLIGAHFEIHSQLGAGCRVRCALAT